jgi:pyrimidine operon attenuation protein/uracil phosphoribosyltransferase
MRTQYDESDVKRVLEHLEARIAAVFPPEKPLCVIGVRTRGETLAHRLIEMLKRRGFGEIRHGVLDITMYRDDLSEIGPKPMVRPTRVDFDIGGIPLLLVDDVLFTGRSIRAALNALVDLGRPSVIRLAVLVDRGGRELPIQADYAGLALNDVPADHRVNVHLVEVDGVDDILVEPRGESE